MIFRETGGFERRRRYTRQHRACKVECLSPSRGREFLWAKRIRNSWPNPPVSARIRNQKKRTKRGRACGATPFRLPIPIFNFGGVYWTKFETISGKIRRILTNDTCASAARDKLARGKTQKFPTIFICGSPHTLVWENLLGYFLVECRELLRHFIPTPCRRALAYKSSERLTRDCTATILCTAMNR